MVTQVRTRENLLRWVQRLLRQPGALVPGVIPLRLVRRLHSGPVESILLLLLAERLRIRSRSFEDVATRYGFRSDGTGGYPLPEILIRAMSLQVSL